MKRAVSVTSDLRLKWRGNLRVRASYGTTAQQELQSEITTTLEFLQSSLAYTLDTDSKEMK